MLDWLFDTLFAAPFTAPARRGSEAVWIDPVYADSLGLVGIGGDLRPERLLTAYRNGIFPMYEEGEPICWWSPDPRAIFEMNGLHVSRRLRRTLRSSPYRVTFDRDFPSVMRGCAVRDEGTWITRDMRRAYGLLHRLGHAHSVEVWEGRELIGGVYGVAIGGLFAGESMFYRRTDASKIALVRLFERLRECGFVVFDTQIINDHTKGLGAVEIPRQDYLDRVREATQLPVVFRSD
jgi:leucyl/phenylalanyl-tRNA--protein transferase